MICMRYVVANMQIERIFWFVCIFFKKNSPKKENNSMHVPDDNDLIKRVLTFTLIVRGIWV